MHVCIVCLQYVVPCDVGMVSVGMVYALVVFCLFACVCACVHVHMCTCARVRNILCVYVQCFSLLLHVCVIFRVSSHWTQKLTRPPKFEARTTGALNAIAEEHWKRWLEEDCDRETDAAEQLMLNNSHECDAH